MKKIKLYLINSKFLILNTFIILYFIVNFFDGNRGYLSLQKKKNEYDKLSSIEKILIIENKKLLDENQNLIDFKSIETDINISKISVICCNQSKASSKSPDV